MKSNKSFRIDDLLCKKVGSSGKVTSVGAISIVPSSAILERGRSLSSPSTTRSECESASPVHSNSPDENIILDLQNRKCRRNNLQVAGNNEKSSSILSALTSSTGTSSKARNSPAPQQSSVITTVSSSNHLSNHNYNNRFNHQNYSNNHSRYHPYARVERKIHPTTLTFYSPTPSPPSPKTQSSTAGNNELFPFSAINGNGHARSSSSTRSSPSDGRSSTNSLNNELFQQYHHQQQVLKGHPNPRHLVPHNQHHILSHQQHVSVTSSGAFLGTTLTSSPPSSYSQAATATAVAAAAAGLIPSIWSNAFLPLPLIDPSTGQPNPSVEAAAASFSAARHNVTGSNISAGHSSHSHHHLGSQASIAERAALLFSLNNRFSPYGIPFGAAGRPSHLLLTGSPKRKGGQIRFSNSVTGQLEKSFLKCQYLNAEDRKKLAASLGLSDRQVKTWFQNRRAKWKKSNDSRKFEAESHISGSSYNGHHDVDSPDDGRRCESVNSLD